MTNRFVVMNVLRVALLVVFLVSSSRAIEALALGALIATVVVDFVSYRREKALEEEDVDEHVPMPPDRVRRGS